ncbi:MAG: hypothetical protein IJS01_07215 [Lentisphaeria bacterium]|nr:hypothetical protein [Lentisphaeria bacterium]
MYFSEYGGVYFVEGIPADAKIIGNISTVVDGVFCNAQLKTLDDVKREMALQVRRNGGNAVVAFKYGQHSMGFWRSLFSLDNVYWKGEGKIASINPLSPQQKNPVVR